MWILLKGFLNAKSLIIVRIRTVKNFALNDSGDLKFLQDALKFWWKNLRKWRFKNIWRYTLNNYVNSLIFSASINSYFPKCIIISKFFKNVWVFGLIFSAFSQILTDILKSSLVHLFMETNALIFSAFGKTLAVSFLNIFEYLH